MPHYETARARAERTLPPASEIRRRKARLDAILRGATARRAPDATESALTDLKRRKQRLLPHATR